MERIIEDAKKIAYQSILLDTLPFLKSAIHLYKKFSFIEIDAYNNSPIENNIYETRFKIEQLCSIFTFNKSTC